MKLISIYNKFSVFFNVSIVSLVLFKLFDYFLPDITPYTVDSQSYLTTNSLRTPGYPLFLKICNLISNHNTNIICLIQKIFLIISGSICFQICCNFIKKEKIFSILGILAIGNPLMWKYSNLILSESLYISFCLIFFSLFIFGLKKNNKKYLMISSFFLALLILIRPVGYSFIIPFVIIIFFESRKYKSIFKLLAPMLLVLLFACSYNFFNKGYFGTQIFGGYNIVGQVSHFLKSKNSDVKITQKIEEKLLERNKLIDGINKNNLSQQFWITTTTYNFSVWQVISPLVNDYVNENYKNFSDVEKQIMINKICWRISLDTIFSNPISYIHIVAIHFYSMWTVPHITNLSIVTPISKVLEKLDSRFQLPEFTKNQLPDLVIYFKVILSIIIFFYSIFSIYMYLILKNRKFLIPAVCSLLINFNHLLVSLVEPAIPRYILTVLPFIIILSGIMVLNLFDFYKTRSL